VGAVGTQEGIEDSGAGRPWSTVGTNGGLVGRTNLNSQCPLATESLVKARRCE